MFEDVEDILKGQNVSKAVKLVAGALLQQKMSRGSEEAWCMFTLWRFVFAQLVGFLAIRNE